MKYPIRSPHALKQQRGVVLFITLIVLVAMMLASVGMMRSVDTSIFAVQNLTSRQSANASSGQAIEGAIALLSTAAQTNRAALQNDGALGAFYFSTPNGGEDNRGVPSRLLTAAPTGALASAPDNAGNTTFMTIERLCNAAGVAPTATICAGNSGGMDDPVNQLGEEDMDSIGGGVGFQEYYRVTVRVDGPNNTRAFVQALITL